VRSRRQKGYSLVEMIAMAIVIVPLFLALIDLYFVILGYWWTVSHCRAAARAAAQGPPNALARDEPLRRALLYMNVSGADGNSTLRLTDCNVTDSLRSIPDLTTGGAVSGTVTVNVTVEVIPPFLLKMGVPGQKFVVNSSQSSPYTYVLRAKPEQPDTTKPLQ
jgi:hypothetical protein